jgi:hypothetical protein
MSVVRAACKVKGEWLEQKRLLKRPPPTKPGLTWVRLERKGAQSIAADGTTHFDYNEYRYEGKGPHEKGTSDRAVSVLTADVVRRLNLEGWCVISLAMAVFSRRERRALTFDKWACSRREYCV